MADETEKITYEIIVDDSKATGAAKKVADGLKDVGSSAKAAKESALSFSDGLNKVAPGLSGVVTGFQGMTKGALAFIATPIGLVVAALGLAIGALTKYFQGSEEGQDKLAKAMAIGKVVMEAVINVVEKLGEVLSNALGFLGDLALSVVNKIAPSIGKVLNDAIKAGSDIAELEDKIEQDENDFIVRRAEVNRKVADLREQAIKAEGAAKRQLIKEAIDLEKDLADRETSHAKDKLALIDKEIAVTKNATEEQKKRRAEALAATIDADARGQESTLRFQKQVESLDNAEKTRADAQLARLNAINDLEKLISDARADRAAQESIQLEKDAQDAMARLDAKAQASQDLEFSIIADMKREADEERRLSDESVKLTSKDSEQKTRITKLENQNKLSLFSSTLGQIKGLMDQGTAAYKALAIAQSSIDTFRAATAALAPPPVGAGPLFGPILAATTIAIGLANIAKIASFQEGGILHGPRHAQGGIPFSVGGRLGFEAEGGEAIINRRSTAMYKDQLSAINVAGGGVGFAVGGQLPFATSDISQRIDGDRLFQDMIDVMRSTSDKVLVIEDFERFNQRRTKVIDESQR